MKREKLGEFHLGSYTGSLFGKRHIFCWLWLSFLLVACRQNEIVPVPYIRPVAEGLLNPVGLASLPDGTLLIAEEGTGERDNSAGVSLITPEGQIGRLISGLPSSRDSGDLSGVPLVAVAPNGTKLYFSHFNLGHLWTLPLDLEQPLQLPAKPFTTDDLMPAMQPLNRVQLVNPFDMTFDSQGVPVVSDASANGVAKEKPDGTTTFFHQFVEIENPINENRPIDPVPTGITRVGAEYYVTLTGGCPYPLGGGQLVAIDENRNERQILSGLNMPIDVALAPDGTLWLLEFARFTPDASCFDASGYEMNSGRLSRLLEDGTLETIITELNFPGAILPMPDGSIYISEVFGGRILHLTWGPPDAPPAAAAVLEAPPQPTLTPTPVPRWHFENDAERTRLDFHHGAFQTGLSPDPIAMMGAGLCWLDYDNDGWLDLYLVNSYAQAEVDFWQAQGGLPQNALLRNRGGSFTDVSQTSGTNISLRGNGCVAADFNLDGWTDLYLTADGPNALLWNQGDGTFIEGANKAGVASPEWNSAAVVGDLNQDGLPDLFVASYINLANKIENPSGAFPQDYYGLADHLYLNKGPNPKTGLVSFREITIPAGLSREERTLGALLSDFDNDGDLDLMLANDGQPNRMYANELWPIGIRADPKRIGFRFVDLTESADIGDSGSGMGVTTADYDGDGQFDLFVTNWDTELNAIYRNQTEEQGFLNFRYNTYRIGIAGLGANMTSWGASWADFDHDSDEDLLVVNGRVPVTNPETDRELIRFYGNLLVEGKPGQFREWTTELALGEVGPLMARGSAAADFDNDGDLDVAINTIAGSAVLLRNLHPPGNWLQIIPNGFYPGLEVRLTLADGRVLAREWHVGSSYLASEDPRLHFGLGAVEIVPQLTAIWPDGRQLTYTDVSVNQQLKLSAP